MVAPNCIFKVTMQAATEELLLDSIKRRLEFDHAPETLPLVQLRGADIRSQIRVFEGYFVLQS